MVKGFQFIKKIGGVEEYFFKKNGLRVLVKEDHSTPIVGFNITYLVGGRNEHVGCTGSTHILEHMLFKGSKNFDGKKNKLIMNLLEDVGAKINATTSLDRTNYYALVPSEHLELVIRAEADRMRGALLPKEEWAKEMTVVRNEFERDENDPESATYKELLQSAYQAHPYHHGVIGWLDDIENATVEKLREFYDKFYWPNNAVVMIVGDSTVKKSLGLVSKYYGAFPRSPQDIPRVHTKEPKQEGPRRSVIGRKAELGILGLAFKIPSALHHDMPVLYLLSDALNYGKSSRLYKSLVDKGLARSVNTSLYPTRDDGLFEIFVKFRTSKKHENIEKIVKRELAEIKRSGVSKVELDKVRVMYRRDKAFSLDGHMGTMMGLNTMVGVGDWTRLFNIESKINKVTGGDIKRVANKYLVEDQSTTVYFVAKK